MEGQNISSTDVKKKRFNNKWIRAAIPALLIDLFVVKSKPKVVEAKTVQMQNITQKNNEDSVVINK